MRIVVACVNALRHMASEEGQLLDAFRVCLDEHGSQEGLPLRRRRS